MEMISHIKAGMQPKGIEKRVMRLIFGPKRDANKKRRRLHNN
jgi:hypothetical protein